MSTAGEIRRPGTTTSEDQPLTLSEEHGLLLRQVAVRAEELLAVTADGGWPARELQALLTYMRVEVLRQAADEERLLFPSYIPSAALDRLGRDHTILHLMTEMLATAATDGGPHIPAELAATTRELLTHLERHLGSEEAVLAANGGRGEAPGATVLTRRPHAWFGLSEGDEMDLDALPAAQVVDAVVDRLSRLRAGERFQLRSCSDPYPVWQRLDRICPGDYGFDYLEDGPRRWRVRITRGPAAT